MNWIAFAIGAIVSGFGVFSGIMRFIKPSRFTKLGAMKARWGDKLGAAWHFTSYVILPVIFGLILLIAGYAGINIREVLS